MTTMLATGLAVGIGGTARAQDGYCSPLTGAEATAAVNASLGALADRQQVQAGLRSFLGQDARALNDGRIGPVTVQALADLCRDVPVAEGTQAVPGTLDLAREYARLAALLPDWRDRLAKLALSPEGFDPLLVRLAGTPEMATLVLGGPGASDCAGLASYRTQLSPEAQRRLDATFDAILAADPGAGDIVPPDGSSPVSGPAAAQICERYPVAGNAAAFVAAMARLDDIITQRPDAVTVLGSGAFRAWIAADQLPRLVRLAGTGPAVIQLLDAFARRVDTGAASAPAAAPAPAGAAATTATGTPAVETSPLAVDCPAPRNMTGLEYFELRPDEIAALGKRADVRAALAPVGPVRATLVPELGAAMSAALGIAPDSCPGLRLNAIVVAEAEASVVFSLDPQITRNLLVKPEVSRFQTAIDALKDVEAPSQAALLASIRDGVMAQAVAVEDAAAATAAQIAAAVAEEPSRGTDTLAAGFPQPTPAAPAAATVVLTPRALQLFAARTEVPEYAAVVRSLAPVALQSRAILEASVRAALAPVAQRRATAATDAAMAQVEASGVIVKRYLLNEPMTARIETDPAFRAVALPGVSTLETVMGVAYPFSRLMDRALVADPPGLGMSDARLFTDIARTQVPDGARQTGPFSEDCGCSAPRAENALVYGFYPFWLAEPAPSAAEIAPESQTATSAATDASAAAPPAPAGPVPAASLAPVDFELIDRLAFDGLEIGADGVVRNRDRWIETGPNFIVSAHRHQTMADISIRLRNWQSWKTADVRPVAQAILALMQQVPYPKETAHYWRLGHELDRLLPRRPDGVTLVVTDFPAGIDQNPPPSLGVVVELVRELAKQLPSDAVKINLALDLDLRPRTDGPVLNPFTDRDLLQILPGAVVQSPIDYVLVFLERPTTDTKKRLRTMVEEAFTGIRRIQVMRSVIPVVPPGANEKVGLEQPVVPYGQFTNDVLYFLDNFGGIGLWPASTVSGHDGAGQVIAKWFAPGILIAAVDDVVGRELRPAGISATVFERMRPVCTYTCPRRMVVYFIMAVTAVTLVSLVVLSFFSGVVNRITSKLLVVPMLYLVLMLLLLMSQTCDRPASYWPLITFGVLAVLIVALTIYQWYQRRVDGPQP